MVDPIEPTLAMGAALSMISASLFMYVGYVVGRRRLDGAARFAVFAFQLWWWTIGLVTVVGVAFSLGGALGLVNLPLFVTMTHLLLFLICVALWGLLYYLLYLFTGRTWVATPLTVFYFVYWAALVYFVQASQPIGIEVKRWSTTLVYARELPAVYGQVIAFLIILPEVFGAMAYFSLFFRSTDATQRYRILLVSWSIIIWFGSSAVATAAQLSQDDSWQIVSRFIGLAATLVILAAYHPPLYVKRHLHVLSIADQAYPVPSHVTPPSLVR